MLIALPQPVVLALQHWATDEAVDSLGICHRPCVRPSPRDVLAPIGNWPSGAAWCGTPSPGRGAEGATLQSPTAREFGLKARSRTLTA